MQPLTLLPLLLPLLFSLAYSQTLNLTAYEYFYSLFCYRPSPSDPYPITCDPFSVYSLWIPSDAPEFTTAIVSSTTPLDFVIPQNISYLDNFKVELYGEVNFIIEGTFKASCEFHNNSRLAIQYGGNLTTYSSTFHDSTSLFMDSGFLLMDTVTANGTNVSFVLTGGTSEFIQMGNINSLDISGTANVTGERESSLLTYFFSLSGNATVAAVVAVITEGKITGGGAYVYSIFAIESGSIIIEGCANISQINTQNSGSITYYYDALNTSKCTVGKVVLMYNATATFIGNSELVIEVLEQNPFIGNAVLSFVATFGTATVYLPGDFLSKGILDFTGNVVVYAGDSNPFLLWGANVTNGSVQFFANYVTISYPFQFVPNFTLIIPKGGDLYLSDIIFSLDTNFQWLPGGVMTIGPNSTATSSSDLELLGKTLVLENLFSENVSLSVPSVTIGANGSIGITAFSATIKGNVVAQGGLNFGVAGNNATLNILGNFSVQSTGELNLGQTFTVNNGTLERIYGSFLNVSGSVTLGGRLTVPVSSSFPSSPPSLVVNFESVDVPLMISSSKIEGTFSSFDALPTPRFEGLFNGKVDSFYKVDNNEVFLHVQKHTSEKEREKIWYIIGGAILSVIVLAVILIFAIRRCQKRRHYERVNQ